MARPKSIEGEMTVSDENRIDNHQKFQAAIIAAQGNLLSDPSPAIEVSPEFMLALSGGRDIETMTYSKPSVRVFKEGTMDRILREEDMTVDDFYNLEIKKKNELARR